ncbi:MAG: FHA domain-containing protein [Planctomycetaceae bacterium]|nr:FHA domain-containing protein [Planctomycetaceae bacterium]
MPSGLLRRVRPRDQIFDRSRNTPPAREPSRRGAGRVAVSETFPLALDGEGAHVRDLGSANGTWINGRRIDEGFLRPGDELSIAHLRYRLEFTDRGDAVQPPGEDQPPASSDVPTL